MTKIEQKANAKATELVAAYRAAAKSSSGLPLRARYMNQDRANGAIDALWELFPHLPAWKATGWTQ